jgi:tRNA G18 (ribose-2'-O)-methylase SpoU
MVVVYFITMTDTLPTNANVIDKYKNDRLTRWTTELVKKDLQQKAFPYAVLMENFAGDFNISSVIRSANAFNAKAVYYLGHKHYDRRGTVGTHHYTDVVHLKNREQILDLKREYEIVGIENTVEGAIALGDAEFSKPVIFILGEEGIGITPETMAICDRFIYIPQFGSVRSLNAAVAGSIIMNDFVTKYNKLKQKT